MSHKKALAIGLAAVSLLLTTAVVLAAVVTIDSFNDGLQNLEADPDAPSDNDVVDHASILGGERDAIVNWLSGPGSVSLEIDRFSSNYAAFNQGNDVTGNAYLVWDGNDGDATTLSFGLGADLLSSSPDNDAFRFRVVFNDSPITVRLRAYTANASQYSEAQVTTAGGINTGNSVDYIIPFTSFSAVGGGATWSDVDALEVFLDGTPNAAADFSMDHIDVVSSMFEYGDLPNSYGAAVTTTYHLRSNGLRLGARVDAEVDGQPDGGAAGDDAVSGLNLDDEDAVTRGPNGSSGQNWTPGTFASGAGGSVAVTVHGSTCGSSSAQCYLRGWIDWDDDSVLEPTEVVVSATISAPTAGTTNYSFNVPDPAPACYDGTCYARFRLCGTADGTNDCSSPTGNSTTGEVEDYAWAFGPTAVALSSLQAQPTTSSILPVALVGVSMAALIGVVFFARRRKTA